MNFYFFFPSPSGSEGEGGGNRATPFAFHPSCANPTSTWFDYNYYFQYYSSLLKQADGASTRQHSEMRKQVAMEKVLIPPTETAASQVPHATVNAKKESHEDPKGDPHGLNAMRARRSSSDCRAAEKCDRNGLPVNSYRYQTAAEESPTVLAEQRKVRNSVASSQTDNREPLVDEKNRIEAMKSAPEAEVHFTGKYWNHEGSTQRVPILRGSSGRYFSYWPPGSECAVYFTSAEIREFGLKEPPPRPKGNDTHRPIDYTSTPKHYNELESGYHYPSTNRKFQKNKMQGDWSDTTKHWKMNTDHRGFCDERQHFEDGGNKAHHRFPQDGARQSDARHTSYRTDWTEVPERCEDPVHRGNNWKTHEGRAELQDLPEKMPRYADPLHSEEWCSRTKEIPAPRTHKKPVGESNVGAWGTVIASPTVEEELTAFERTPPMSNYVADAMKSLLNGKMREKEQDSAKDKDGLLERKDNAESMWVRRFRCTGAYKTIGNRRVPIMQDLQGRYLYYDRRSHQRDTTSGGDSGYCFLSKFEQFKLGLQE